MLRLREIKMERVYIVSGCRTPIGTMGGCLSSIPSARLGTIVVKEAIRRAGITPDQVEEVFMGNAIQAGGKPNVARQVLINSGIPIESPATTVNVLCGSGLHSINLAARMIRMGDRDIVAAGGCENMSAAPYLIQKGRYGYRMGAGTIEDSMIYDALNDAFYDYHMGITAENIAEQWQLTREELDAFAVSSQNKCERARKEGRFKDEIVPVEVKTRDGVTMETISGLSRLSRRTVSSQLPIPQASMTAQLLSSS